MVEKSEMIYNYENISEKILKQLILEDLDNFLMELGDGFTYIKNEYKIKLGVRPLVLLYVRKIINLLWNIVLMRGFIELHMNL